MSLNKQELKKLHHQRNLLNSSSSSYSLKHRHQQTLMYNYYQQSSGYNSANHSNSSASNSQHTSRANLNYNHNSLSQLNFYKLSLSHLPVHYVHSQCSCGAANINSSFISSVGSSDLSLMIEDSKHKLSSNVISSSPNLKTETDFDDEEVCYT